MRQWANGQPGPRPSRVGSICKGRGPREVRSLTAKAKRQPRRCVPATAPTARCAVHAIREHDAHNCITRDKALDHNPSRLQTCYVRNRTYSQMFSP
jgi:hypothetical protein